MKAIYLSDLALQYFPHSTSRSAVSQLRRWIVLNSDQGAALSHAPTGVDALAARSRSGVSGRAVRRRKNRD